MFWCLLCAPMSPMPVPRTGPNYTRCNLLKPLESARITLLLSRLLARAQTAGYPEALIQGRPTFGRSLSLSLGPMLVQCSCSDFCSLSSGVGAGLVPSLNERRVSAQDTWLAPNSCSPRLARSRRWHTLQRIGQQRPGEALRKQRKP